MDTYLHLWCEWHLPWSSALVQCITCSTVFSDPDGAMCRNPVLATRFTKAWALNCPQASLFPFVLFLSLFHLVMLPDPWKWLIWTLALHCIVIDGKVKGFTRDHPESQQQAQTRPWDAYPPWAGLFLPSCLPPLADGPRLLDCLWFGGWGRGQPMMLRSLSGSRTRIQATCVQAGKSFVSAAVQG